MPYDSKCVLTAQEKNGSYCTPLQNKKMILKNLAVCTLLLNRYHLNFKNLAFCTLSRKKKLEFNVSAELRENSKSQAEIK